MYDIKNLLIPKTLDEAINYLNNENTLVIAGGSDILIELRHGKHNNKTLVSISKLDELRGIEIIDGNIHIGPLSTFTEVAEDKLINKHIPILAEAVKTIGGPQLRNMGTIGGNICNGITSADSASSLFVLDAILEITGPNGVRHLPITDFYVWVGEVKLEQGEILTKIIIKEENYKNYYGSYYKYAKRNAMDIAIQGCSVLVQIDNDIIKDVKIGYGVGGPIPMRCFEAEKSIKGKVISKETLEQFGDAVLKEVNPRTSWKATKEFRQHLANELAQRMLTKSIERAGGKI